MLMEVKAVVNGIEIIRYKGHKAPYYINIREGNTWKEFHTFNTLKAAKEFAAHITK